LESNKAGGLIPSVAVVICTYNRPLLLDRCLRRIQQIDYPDFSVVVVDSAPKSSEAKLLAARYGANYEVSPLKGLSRARNIGTRATEADIIAYLDDDMIPHTGWLRSLIEELSDKDVVAATGPVLTLEFADSIDGDLRAQVDWGPWGPHRFHIDRSSPQWFERTCFGGIGNGNFALRRDGFDEIRGFDERIGRGAAISSGEEHYAYFRLVEFGFKIAYSPQAIVFHPSPLMTREALQKRLAENFAYVAFLLFNHPSKSLRIIIFFVEGIFGARRRWRTLSGVGFTSLSIRDKLLSSMLGLSSFLRSVL